LPYYRKYFKLNKILAETTLMITLTPDEVALLKSLLVALRGIKTREIDKALVILSKVDQDP